MHRLIVLGLIGILPVLAQQDSHIVARDVLIPMRDGVRLATDIYFPARDGRPLDGRFPVILERTPYSKEGGARPWTVDYAERGYVAIRQDTRGRYKSEGVWHMMVDDVNDGFDTAAWIAKQPWSDGSIGMLGTSYTGGTQHAMALSGAPALKATIPVDAVANAGYFGMRYGGAFEQRFFNWIFLNAGRGSRASRDPGTREVLVEAAERRKEYLAQIPLRRGTTPLRLAPEYEDWLVYAMDHGENDQYWKQPGFGVADQTGAYKDIPVLLIGGWYDSWARQTTMSYMALAKTKKSPQKVIMGPWIHGQNTRSAHGQVDFGESAALDGVGFRLRWYDRWLKNIQNGAENDAPVRIFVMGTGTGKRTAEDRLDHGGSWRDEKEWPLARAKATPFYLHADGTLSQQAPADASSSTSYDFDPRNPVPTIGGNISSGDGIMLQGGWDQKCGAHVWNCGDELPLSARRDILVFQSAPLDRDMEVTGPIDVKLWISSSAVDTDFTAKLIDAYPPSADYPGGFDLNIGDGILRARFRNSLEKAELMKPGEIYPITVQLYPTSNVFKKGHRIRIDVSSSNYPRFDVNPNTGEPLNRHRRMVTAVNTVHHDRARPSHVILPAVPR
ncbi:MAG: CocE/NonD family hydrolase [Bryobacterales bacterium]|nr:CocE/NonD family hydrolase [Bryobacterales bacterium]